MICRSWKDRRSMPRPTASFSWRASARVEENCSWVVAGHRNKNDGAAPQASQPSPATGRWAASETLTSQSEVVVILDSTFESSQVFLTRSSGHPGATFHIFIPRIGLEVSFPDFNLETPLL